jgi:hypothetical protein
VWDSKIAGPNDWFVRLRVAREGDLETRDEDDLPDRATTKVRQKLAHVGLADHVVDHDREARLAVVRSDDRCRLSRERELSSGLRSPFGQRRRTA